VSTTSPVRQAPTFRNTNSFVLSANLLFAVSAIGASTQSVQLQRQLSDLNCYYALPASSRRDPRRERFRSLAQQWRRETQWLSSTTEIAMNPAYQAIIGMGAEALPLILEDLRQNSGHWYWALKAISNEDPVVPRDRGSVKKMKSAWLQWGETKGLVGA
jgi:site-specific recombinase XerC